jgi:hypothetical protein
MLCGMPRLLYHVDDAHLQYLNARFEFLRQVGVPPAEETTVVIRERDEEATYADRSGQLDAFTQQSIGTMFEPEAHQNSGGVVVLGYPDGTYREIRIDMTRDGYSMPRIGSALSRRRRFGLRFRR